MLDGLEDDKASCWSSNSFAVVSCMVQRASRNIVCCWHTALFISCCQSFQLGNVSVPVAEVLLPAALRLEIWPLFEVYQAVLILTITTIINFSGGSGKHLIILHIQFYFNQSKELFLLQMTDLEHVLHNNHFLMFGQQVRPKNLSTQYAFLQICVGMFKYYRVTLK